MRPVGEHWDYIHQPLSDILEKGIMSCNVLGDGIETYPISDYVFQSLFLKMTGAQEQKLKCIWWDVSTANFDFRREYLQSQIKISECSSYDSKSLLYNKLCSYIRKMDKTSSIIEDSLKNKMISETIIKLKDLFTDSVLLHWNKKMYNDFLVFKTRVRPNHFFEESKLLQNPLKKANDSLYICRNRFAHNTLSYQRNLPSFKYLYEYNCQFDNFYTWFFILILLDMAFVALFDRFIVLDGDKY